jgi:hypothetical protein
MIVTVAFAVHLARSVLTKTPPQLPRRHTLPAVISVRITFGRFLKVSCVVDAKKKGNTFDEIRHRHGRRIDFHTGSSVSRIKLRTVRKSDLSLRASVRAMCSFKLLRRRFDRETIIIFCERWLRDCRAISRIPLISTSIRDHVGLELSFSLMMIFKKILIVSRRMRFVSRKRLRKCRRSPRRIGGIFLPWNRFK